MIKHLELAKFIEKLVIFLSFLKLFGQISAIMDFKIQKFLAEIFSLRLHQIGSIV